MENVDFLTLPSRPEKPRTTGHTMVIDNGIGLMRVRQVIEESSHLIDYVKLGWGTAVVTPNLKEKLSLYQEASIPVCFGGTFFELAYLQGKTDEYINFVRDMGIDILEISDGSIVMEHERKLELVNQLSGEFKVVSEYGSKDAEVVYAPSKWVRAMIKELEAGAWKVIAEGRESGTAGMYRSNSELRSGLVDEIVESIDVEKLIWEAPQKSQQVQFIRKFGQNVNLGNIPWDGVIPLETLRLGLRGDTVLDFHS